MFRKRRAFLSVFLVIMALVGISVWLFCRNARQHSLDGAFITAVNHAVNNKNMDTALSLLRQGADINTRQPLDVSTSPREYLHTLFDRLRGRHVAAKTTWSALMLTVTANDTNLTLTLLNRGAAGVNDTAEWTPLGSKSGQEPLLVIAARRGNAELVQALLAHGAHIEARGTSGETALLASSYEPDILLRNGWLATSRIYLAASQRYRILLPLLLNHGADPKARSDSGQSVLYRSAIYGQTEDVALLLARGADINDCSNLEGRSTLMLAARQGNESSARYLVNHGAAIKIHDKDGETALMLAEAQGGDDGLNIARYLLDHGAEINARQNDGMTALDLAAKHENKPMIALLKSRGGRK